MAAAVGAAAAAAAAGRFPERAGARPRRPTRRPEVLAVGPCAGRSMSWLREPLLHFLILGSAIFLLADLVGDPAGGRADRIRLTAGDVELLRQGFQRTWQRAPSAAELAGLVEDRVREEIYYREALALGLDRDDTIVRRRLRQKMEFLSEDLAAELPTDADLEAWLGANPERFRVEPRIHFRQVFLSRDRRGDRLRADAERLLAGLRAGDGRPDPAELGDPIPLPAEAGELSASEVARLFGGEFAAGLFELAPGRWEGPIDSAYGAHLVLVRERVPGRDPPLAEVREAVAREWSAERRSRAREDLYRALRARYDVRVEAPPEQGLVGASAAEAR